MVRVMSRRSALFLRRAFRDMIGLESGLKVVREDVRLLILRVLLLFCTRALHGKGTKLRGRGLC